LETTLTTPVPVAVQGRLADGASALEMPRFDKLDAAGRSALMATIRKTNTKPELLVRRAVHAMGYRFRLHRRDLPGTPDLVFPGPRKVIFVHGCFWHRHDCAAGRKVPSKNLHYWQPKFARTRERDRRTAEQLEAAGWKSLVVWECQLVDKGGFERAVRAFLRSDRAVTTAIDRQDR
jgi:DNA mismatch endonuclease (patch repair protein)